MTVHLRVTVGGASNLTSRRVGQALDAADLTRYRSNSRSEGDQFRVWLDMPGDDFRASQILVRGALHQQGIEDVEVDLPPRSSHRTGQQPGWPWRNRRAVIPKPKEAPGP